MHAIQQIDGWKDRQTDRNWSVCGRTDGRTASTVNTDNQNEILGRSQKKTVTAVKFDEQTFQGP